MQPWEYTGFIDDGLSTDWLGRKTTTLYDFRDGGKARRWKGFEADVNRPEGAWMRDYLADVKEVSDSLDKHDDDRDSIVSQMAYGTHDYLKNPEPGFFGRIFNHGPIAGSLLGAAGGAGLGAILNLFTDKEKRLADFRLLGALVGAAGGGVIGHTRTREVGFDPYKKTEEKKASMQKQATMFNDPRNFILEKLQGARDVSVVDKARLAQAVRSMDNGSASRLAQAVRSAVGMGVGALIARFIFGSGWTGTVMGGLAGLAGAAMLQTMVQKNKPTSLFQGNRYYNGYQ